MPDPLGSTVESCDLTPLIPSYRRRDPHCPELMIRIMPNPNHAQSASCQLMHWLMRRVGW